MEFKSNDQNLNIKFDNKNLQAYQTMMKLKNLFRQGWLRRGISKEQCESVADHSFGTAILALLITPPPLDKTKVISMMLVHEAGEALIGDIIPQDEISSETKRKMEQKAVESIFSDLQEGKDLIALWNEFETGTSPEAFFSRDLDKFEMALQANLYSEAFDINLEEFKCSAEEIVQDEILLNIIKSLKK